MDLEHMTLDDVDLWNLWLDAEEEASLFERERRRPHKGGFEP